MKRLLITFCFFSTISLSAQKFYTKTGTTEFKASVEAFEPVEATSKSTTAILNTATGEIAALIFVKSFHFDVALMEEHFNENYLDTKDFPKATFKGKLQNFELSIKKTGDIIIVKGLIIISPSDFKIEIPRAVSSKISNKIKVIINYELVEKK